MPTLVAYLLDLIETCVRGVADPASLPPELMQRGGGAGDKPVGLAGLPERNDVPGRSRLESRNEDNRWYYVGKD